MVHLSSYGDPAYVRQLWDIYLKQAWEGRWAGRGWVGGWMGARVLRWVGGQAWACGWVGGWACVHAGAWGPWQWQSVGACQQLFFMCFCHLFALSDHPPAAWVSEVLLAFLTSQPVVARTSGGPREGGGSPYFLPKPAELRPLGLPRA